MINKLISKLVGQRKSVRYTPTENGFYENGVYHSVVSPSEEIRCHQITEAVRTGRLDPRRGHEMLCNGEVLK